MAVLVRIPSPLRNLTGGQDRVQTAPGRLAEVIDELERRFPGIRDRLVDGSGELRRFVIIFLNGEDVRFLRGLDTPVRDGDEVSIVPAVSGGAPTPPLREEEPG